MKNVLLGLVALGAFAIAGSAQAADPHAKSGFDLNTFAKGISLDRAQPIQLAHGGGWGGGGGGYGGGGYGGGGWGGGYPGGGWGGGYPGGGHGCYHPPVCRTYPYPYGGGGGFSLYGPRGGFSIRY